MATSEQVNYVPPTCEDYHSDDSGVLESFTGRKSPAAANVSTKRSHPSDLDKEKPPAQERAHANIDLRSDSGYSSLTAATVSSADSAPSATVAPPSAVPVASQSPAPKTRRPTVSSEQRQHSNSSPRPKPLSRTASQSSRRPPNGQRRPTLTQDRRDREEECVDPNCTKCGPNALPRRRLDLLPSQSARNISIPSDQRSMQSDPAAYYASPPSPTYTRQPTYMQGPAVVQPAQQPRRRSSSTSRPRPMSYSGEPGAPYWVPGMPAPYPSPPQERGPPPAPSAYRNMSQYNHMPAASQMGPYMAPHTQPNGYYPQQQYPVQTTPPYDLQRPTLSTRNSSTYGARNQPAPIVTQDRRELPRHSARYGPPQSATQPKFPPLQIGNEAYESPATDSSSEEEYEDPRNTRAVMAPPKLKRSKSPKRRPSLRHAATTQVVDRLERRQSIVIPERPKDRGRAPRVSDASTRVSTSRPAAPSRKTQSEYDTRPARVLVNSSKASRRQTTQIYDKMYEQYAQAKAIEERLAKAKALEEQMAQAQAQAQAREMAETRALLQAEARAREEQYKAEQRRQKRSSKVYYPSEIYDDDDNDGESEEEERHVRPRESRRRPTLSESRKAKERVTTSAAEDYISAQRGSQIPYSDQIHSAAKRASRIPSGPSKSGSSRSEGSDKQSQSARTVATNGNNEIRLRVDASAPLSLQFNGDMEGRTLQLLPAENGMADIVIGNARGGENAYHTSERGSILGSSRKSLVANQARRDAEEMTERSSRSVRSRREGRGGEIRSDRDGQRHVLQRYRN